MNQIHKIMKILFLINLIFYKKKISFIKKKILNLLLKFYDLMIVLFFSFKLVIYYCF